MRGNNNNEELKYFWDFERKHMVVVAFIQSGQNSWGSAATARTVKLHLLSINISLFHMEPARGFPLCFP